MKSFHNKKVILFHLSEEIIIGLTCLKKPNTYKLHEVDKKLIDKTKKNQVTYSRSL